MAKAKAKEKVEDVEQVEDAPKTEARNRTKLLKDHVHAGVKYKAGTDLDDIEGLTPNDVAYISQQNIV